LNSVAPTPFSEEDNVEPSSTYVAGTTWVFDSGSHSSGVSRSKPYGSSVSRPSSDGGRAHPGGRHALVSVSHTGEGALGEDIEDFFDEFEANVALGGEMGTTAARGREVRPIHIKSLSFRRTQCIVSDHRFITLYVCYIHSHTIGIDS